MKRYIVWAIIIGVILLNLAIVLQLENTYEIRTVFVEKPSILNHRQTAYIGALEWCESRATDQINPKDKDNTPSYHYFQFKPSTFKALGERYHIIDGLEGEIMDLIKVYSLQKRIVEQMILDPKTDWENQFPGCVRLLGRPPK